MLTGEAARSSKAPESHVKLHSPVMYFGIPHEPVGTRGRLRARRRHCRVSMPVGFRVQPCPILHRCPMHRGVGPGRARQRPGGAQVEEDPVILPQNGLVKSRRDHDSCHYRVHSTRGTKGRVATTTWGIITQSCTETHQPRDGNANQWSGPRRRQESSERTPRQGRNPNSQGHAQWTKVSPGINEWPGRLSFRWLHNQESRQLPTKKLCKEAARTGSRRTLGIGASCRLARCKTTGAACLPVNDSRAFSHSLKY